MTPFSQDLAGLAVAPAAVVDLTHHTLYVPDNANGESAGLVSMIDTTHCNGDDTATAPTKSHRQPVWKT